MYVIYAGSCWIWNLVVTSGFVILEVCLTFHQGLPATAAPWECFSLLHMWIPVGMYLLEVGMIDVYAGSLG